MKVTQSLTGNVIDLPKYFTNGIAFFMLIDEKTYLKVYDGGPIGLKGALTAYTKFDPAYLLGFEDLTNLRHISEAEFKNAYVKVCLAIEETVYN